METSHCFSRAALVGVDQPYRLVIARKTTFFSCWKKSSTKKSYAESLPELRRNERRCRRAKAISTVKQYTTSKYRVKYYITMLKIYIELMLRRCCCQWPPWSRIAHVLRSLVLLDDPTACSLDWCVDLVVVRLEIVFVLTPFWKSFYDNNNSK